MISTVFWFFFMKFCKGLVFLNDFFVSDGRLPFLLGFRKTFSSWVRLALNFSFLFSGLFENFFLKSFFTLSSKVSVSKAKRSVSRTRGIFFWVISLRSTVFFYSIEKRLPKNWFILKKTDESPWLLSVCCLLENPLIDFLERGGRIWRRDGARLVW